jgi:hypothetical protein
MKILSWEKDGGEKSTVHGLYIIEIKSLFSIILLRFSNGSREAYHSHAFNCFSWILSGKLKEHHKSGKENWITPSWKSFCTFRDTYHKVQSYDTTWALTFRGPWKNNWKEYLEDENRERILTHGRIEI